MRYEVVIPATDGARAGASNFPWDISIALEIFALIRLRDSGNNLGILQ